jgi:predicted nucleotidyltransferase
MNEPIIPSFLQETANVFATLDGVEAVAWCGSSAMGSADSYSDFDLYVYTQTPLPVEQREALIRERATESQLNNAFWELEDEWIDPDGRRFNAMYRACSYATNVNERQ